MLGPEVRAFTSNYIDDLLVSSETFSLHLEHLRQVLQRLKAGVMTVNLDKCRFVRNEVPFLGHILTPTGIKMDTDKMKSIREFPRPTKVKYLRAFLGLCNFYKRFCKNYSEYTHGIRHLLRKNARWKWGEAEERCFNVLKDKFIESVMLIHPDLTKDFVLDSDSSYFALGGVLYQETTDGEIGVVAFISRSLRGPELNYTTTEKELLAIVYALQKCRTYLLGNKVRIRTDHRALVFLNQCRFVNDRMTRWKLFLDQFKITIEHIKGSNNKVTDILSRYPPQNESQGQKTRSAIIATFAVDSTTQLINEFKQLGKHQQGDSHIARLIKLKSGQTTPTISKRRILQNYLINHVILLYNDIFRKTTTIEVPSCLKERLIWQYHFELGHFGANKVYQVMRYSYHWKGMWKQVKRIIATCDLCQKTKRRNYHIEGVLQPIIPNEIGEIVSVDYFGPLPVT